MKLREFKKELNNIARSINRLRRDTDFNKWESLEALTDYDTEDANNIFFLEECGKILDMMGYILEHYKYLQRPILKEGTIEQRGDSFFLQGQEIKDRSIIEIYIYDRERDRYCWKRCTFYIHNGKAFIRDHKGSIAGLRARTRTP